VAEQFESHFAREVADVLKRSGLLVTAEPSIGGLRPDFVATTPDGRTLVVEVKRWVPDRAHIQRAKEQVELYKQATEADAAFIVMSGLERGNPSEGIFTLDELAKEITVPGKVDAGKRGDNLFRFETSFGVRAKTIFAAMPFASAYDDVYFVAMAHAAKAVGATCTRVDREDFEGDVLEEIRREIKQSAGVIADLSESNPNVLFEVGYAHALGKPVVPICRTPLNDLPFDVRNWNTIKYDAGSTFALRDQLASRLKTALKK
jgi:Holliday junction resolvase